MASSRAAIDAPFESEQLADRPVLDVVATLTQQSGDQGAPAPVLHGGVRKSRASIVASGTIRMPDARVTGPARSDSSGS